MPVDRVRLHFGSRAPERIAYVRPLVGDDEDLAFARGGGTATALDLLDRLLVADAAGRSMRAADLTTADRDRLLAAVYVRAFGARVTSVMRCVLCEASFELDFSLRELVRTADANASGLGSDGVVVLSDGRRYRLPTGADECASLASDEPRAALLQRCAVDGVLAGDADTVPALMQAAAPTLDLDLSATCPECSANQSVRFDLQSYLLGALAAEHSQLVRETHRLAAAYHWSRAEILALPRDCRRAHVALVSAEWPKPRQSRA